MASAWVDKGASTKLFNGSKSLKLWSVDDPDAQRMQFYRSPNWVIDNLLRIDKGLMQYEREQITILLNSMQSIDSKSVVYQLKTRRMFSK